MTGAIPPCPCHIDPRLARRRLKTRSDRDPARPRPETLDACKGPCHAETAWELHLPDPRTKHLPKTFRATDQPTIRLGPARAVREIGFCVSVDPRPSWFAPAKILEPELFLDSGSLSEQALEDDFRLARGSSPLECLTTSSHPIRPAPRSVITTILTRAFPIGSPYQLFAAGLLDDNEEDSSVAAKPVQKASCGLPVVLAPAVMAPEDA